MSVRFQTMAKKPGSAGETTFLPSNRGAPARTFLRPFAPSTSERASTFVSLPLQPKLNISRPGDYYEQEADRVAEQVMRMPAPAIQRKPG